MKLISQKQTSCLCQHEEVTYKYTGKEKQMLTPYLILYILQILR